MFATSIPLVPIFSISTTALTQNATVLTTSDVLTVLNTPGRAVAYTNASDTPFNPSVNIYTQYTASEETVSSLYHREPNPN